MSPNPYEPPVLATTADSAPSEDGAVSFEGALTIDEVIAATELAAPRAKGYILQFVYTLIRLAACYILWLCCYVWAEQDFEHLRTAMVGLAAVVCGITIVTGKRFTAWRSLKQMHRQGMGAFGHTRGRVSLERIESRSPSAATVLDWSGFCSAARSSHPTPIGSDFWRSLPRNCPSDSVGRAKTQTS